MATDPFPRPIRTHRRFAALLAATALGVYLLLIVGATTSITNAASACSTWPICHTPTDPLSQTELAIAWGHRLTAVVVGLLVAATAVVAALGDASSRVRRTLLASSALYIIQIGVGAATAVSGPAAITPGLHLGLGVAIFAGIVLALAWDLELTTGSEDDQIDMRGEPEPIESPASDADPAGGRTLPSSGFARARLTAFAYFKMMKPRLMWLLCLVAAAGMALAAGPALDRYTIVATLGGGVLAIGASGTFNHVLERDVDQKMSRTADRPLANDLIPVSHALAFGGLLTVARSAHSRQSTCLRPLSDSPRSCFTASSTRSC